MQILKHIVLALCVMCSPLALANQALNQTPSQASASSVLQQGLDKVQTQLGLVHASLESKDINTAKAQLTKVAALRKRYHKERSPDIWQLIFGS